MTIDEIVDITEKVAEEFNIYLTKKIVDRILAAYEDYGVQLIPSTRRDIVKMLESGKTLQEIEADINKYMPGLEKEVRVAFTNVGNVIEREQDGYLDIALNGLNILHHAPRTGAFVPLTQLYMTNVEKALLESAYKRTNATLRNYTATTAKSTQKQLIKTLDDAYNKVVRGVSINTAISEAIEEYSKVGTVVDFGNGVQQRAETVITRAVRTGLTQASGDITLERCNQLQVSQVLVTSHLGARYTDKHEPANHMWWQGKVYDYNKQGSQVKSTDSVAKQLQQIGNQMPHSKDESAGDFITITGYGTGEGLCGWNCRHTFTPFYPGISINNQRDYDSDENKKRYDLDQAQRAKERKIRDLRRNYEALKHAYGKAPDGPLKDDLKTKQQDAHKKYIDSVKAYNEWSKDNGLRPKQERLKTSNDYRISDEVESEFKRIDIKGKSVKDVYDNREYVDGKVVYEPGVMDAKHANERRVANVMQKIYGGNIKVLEESNIPGIKRPDYLWNGKYWELKTLYKPKAYDSAVRSGLEQLTREYNIDKAEGIVLDCSNIEIDFDFALSTIENRIKRSGKTLKSLDVMLIKGEEVLDIIRYDYK